MMRRRRISDVGYGRWTTDLRGSRMVVWGNWKQIGRGRGWGDEGREEGGGRGALGNLVSCV